MPREELNVTMGPSSILKPGKGVDPLQLLGPLHTTYIHAHAPAPATPLIATSAHYRLFGHLNWA